MHLQKGGITEPRMVIIYEGIAKFGKRVVLQNKTHIGGNYDGKVEELWTEVLTYIENNYDTEYLERIYLQGDGGAWIVSGKEYLIKAKYVLDEFHMKKAVNSIVGRITKINKDEFFECNLNEPLYRFSLLVECILNTLTDKEANTLKVVFGILSENHLRDIDYYQDRVHQNRLVNTFKRSTKDSYLLNRIDIFVSDNEETYNHFQPNGYKALYQYLLGEKIE